MESTQNRNSKKQRNPRNQRDRRRTQDQAAETQSPATPVVNDGTFEPQPQRANRRQRNEPTPQQHTAQPAPPVVQEKKEKVENVVLDTSNFKRETEEIAKLKQKFTKREITSNWHRYCAPETPKEAQEQEDNTAADFSELLRVPVSRGGHLQLKEEQEWAKASATELSGYFALDLKLLSQGIACIPLYEQLQLPKDYFTEEQITHFDALAAQSKECYNPEKNEDPNSKVFKLLTSLVQSETDKEEESSVQVSAGITEEKFNVLDIEGSTQKLINIDLGSDNSCDNKPAFNPDDNKTTIINSSKTLDLNKKEEPKFTRQNMEAQENTQNKKDLRQDKILEIEPLTLDFAKENSPEKISEVNSFVNQTSVSDIDPSSKLIRDVKSLEKENVEKEDKVDKSIITTKEVESNNVDRNMKNEQLVKPKRNRKDSKETLLPANTAKKNTEVEEIKKKEVENHPIESKIITSDLTEKLDKRNDVKDTSKSKEGEKHKNISLDDDDDLDFLLSLKKPVAVKNKKETKQTSLKENTLLPGASAASKPPVQEKHTELDDWLDSVLED